MSVTFRPSLTLAEIQFLLTAIDWDDANQPALLRKLEVFTLKAQHGITKPAHLRVGKPSQAAQLGFEEDETISALIEAYNDPVKRGALSVRQMGRVQYYRYTNDLMTSTEEADYEAAL